MNVIPASEKRLLLLVYYAGHRRLNINWDHNFYTQISKMQSFDYIKIIIPTLVIPIVSIKKKFEQVDIVIILDNCFLGNAIKAILLTEQTTKFIALINAN